MRLFALHPLHVESVAWVSERKDVLSTFFWLLTLWLMSDSFGINGPSKKSDFPLLAGARVLRTGVAG